MATKKMATKKMAGLPVEQEDGTFKVGIVEVVQNFDPGAEAKIFSELPAVNIEFCGGPEGPYCSHLARNLSNPNRKGLAPVQVTNRDTGIVCFMGVAYKEKEADAGSFVNFCPFCGESIRPDEAPKLARKRKFADD